MANNDCATTSATTLSRRRMIALGISAAGGFAGAAVAGCTMPGSTLGGPGSSAANGAGVAIDDGAQTLGGFSKTFPSHVQRTIEEIVQAKGTVNYGVLQIQIDRNDIRDVMLRDTHILPSFEINGDLNFQSLGGSKIIMNSDLCLKRAEIDPFIDQLIKHNIIFQAEHQHFYDFEPIVFFIHFRAIGDAEAIANGCKAALNATSTPLPQAPPKNPHTPLPAAQLGKVIGAKPSVGANGVVSFQVPRAERIILDGVQINPYLNVSIPIVFEPLSGGQAAAVPDFGMIPSEIQHLVGRMRGLDWDIGCLYNQETDEHPQLFFSHQFKTGDPVQLAREIRDGLNMLNVKLIG